MTNIEPSQPKIMTNTEGSEPKFVPINFRSKVPDKRQLNCFICNHVFLLTLSALCFATYLYNRYDSENDFKFLKQLDEDWQKDFIYDVKTTDANDCSEFDTHRYKYKPIFEYQWHGI